MAEFRNFLLLVGLASAATAVAGTLDFSTPNICNGTLGPMQPCSNNLFINQSYGDTALVDVTYLDKYAQSHGSSLLSLKWYGTGYSDLPAVVFGGSGDPTGLSDDEIILTPVAGHTVTLTSFQLGSWGGSRQSHVEVLELGGGTLASYGVQTMNPSPYIASTFTPNVTSSTGIIIHWWDTGYNVGADNIVFSADSGGSAVPEPASCALVSVGMVSLLGLARGIRKSRKT